MPTLGMGLLSMRDETERRFNRAVRGRQFDLTFMQLAQTMAQLGTCPRAQVGAVLTIDRRIIATGYNGAPAGTPHCNEIGCAMEHNHCVRAVHAEQNVLIQCALHGISTRDSVLYCTHRPCLTCTRLLINAGITEIVYHNEYDCGSLAAELLSTAGISVLHL